MPSRRVVAIEEDIAIFVAGCARLGSAFPFGLLLDFGGDGEHLFERGLEVLDRCPALQRILHLLEAFHERRSLVGEALALAARYVRVPIIDQLALVGGVHR